MKYLLVTETAFSDFMSVMVSRGVANKIVNGKISQTLKVLMRILNGLRQESAAVVLPKQTKW